MPFVYFPPRFFQKKSFSVRNGVLVLRYQVGSDYCCFFDVIGFQDFEICKLFGI